MKSDWLKILLIVLLLFTACRKSGSSSQSGGLDILGLSDQTREAGVKIEEANEDLKKIKAIYKESESQTEELREAMKNNETEKVKKIAGDLVVQINEGVNLGNKVISKIEEAKEMKINETYREYLYLKEQALTRQIEAFDIRFEQTKYLRDEFQTNNKQDVEKAKTVLKERDEKFKKKMDAARDFSRQANLLAKESMNKKS